MPALVVRTLIKRRVVQVAAAHTALDYVLAVTRAAVFVAFGVLAVDANGLGKSCDEGDDQRQLAKVALDARMPLIAESFEGMPELVPCREELSGDEHAVDHVVRCGEQTGAIQSTERRE